MSEGKYDGKKALVVRFECGDVVIERASNWCSSTLNAAHALMHVGVGKDWKISIESRLMTSAEYDAMRKKFETEATGEVMALQFESALKAAAEGGEQS